MSNQTIADIYKTNDNIHARLEETITKLNDEQLAFLPDGEKWTIQHIVEHIAIVKDGMSRISAKLLAQAQSAGKQSDGKAILTARELDFIALFADAFDHNLLTFFQLVAHVAHAAIRNFRNMQQTVNARENFDERAEINNSGNRAEIRFADFGFRR
jgi:hypothetical protein